MSNVNKIKVGTYVRIKAFPKIRGRIKEIVNDHLDKHATVIFIQEDNKNTTNNVQRSDVEIVRRGISQDESYLLLEASEAWITYLDSDLSEAEEVLLKQIKTAVAKAKGE